MQDIKSNKSGFTILELLVVISIIGLLVTIGITNFRTVKAKSRDAQRLYDIDQLQNAFEFYYDEYNIYPCTDVVDGCCFMMFAGQPFGPDGGMSIAQVVKDDGTGDADCELNVDCPWRLDIIMNLAKYMLSFPKDPLTGVNDNHDYMYMSLAPFNQGSLCHTASFVIPDDPPGSAACFRNYLDNDYIIAITTEEETAFGEAGEKIFSEDGCLEAPCDQPGIGDPSFDAFYCN